MLDSRVLKPTGVVAIGRHPIAGLLYGEAVYCTSCGCKGGMVTFGMDRRAGAAIFLCGAEDGCGHDCEKRHGVPPEMLTKVPDPVGFERG